MDNGYDWEVVNWSYKPNYHQLASIGGDDQAMINMINMIKP